jgi:hypothetical protein
MWVFLACRNGFDRYEFLEDDQLVAKLTDQRFLLARGFVICDVSALIDHNLFCCMVVFLENDVIHASQFCSNKRFAETEQNVSRLQLQQLQMQKNIREIYICIHDCCSDDYGACEITY